MRKVFMFVGILIVGLLGLSDLTVQASGGFYEGALLTSPVHPSVYVLHKDKNGKMKRHPIVNSKVFHSLGYKWKDVTTISKKSLEVLPLGTPECVKENTYLLKFPFNPKIYAVTDTCTLQHIPDPHTAVAMYGKKWETKIIQLPEIYSLFYRKGDGLPVKKITEVKKDDTSSNIKKEVVETKNFGDKTSTKKTGGNKVNVATCIEGINGISIKRIGQSTYVRLKDGVKDAGHGLRDYTFSCNSKTQYYVTWVEVEKLPEAQSKSDSLVSYTNSVYRCNNTSNNDGIEIQNKDSKQIYRFGNGVSNVKGGLQESVYECVSHNKYKLTKRIVDTKDYSKYKSGRVKVSVKRCQENGDGIVIMREGIGRKYAFMGGKLYNDNYRLIEKDTYSCFSNTSYVYTWEEPTEEIYFTKKDTTSVTTTTPITSTPVNVNDDGFTVQSCTKTNNSIKIKDLSGVDIILTDATYNNKKYLYSCVSNTKYAISIENVNTDVVQTDPSVQVETNQDNSSNQTKGTAYKDMKSCKEIESHVEIIEKDTDQSTILYDQRVGTPDEYVLYSYSCRSSKKLRVHWESFGGTQTDSVL